MTWNLDETVNTIVSKLQSSGAPLEQLDSLRAYHAAALAAFCREYEERFPEAELLGMGGSGVVLKLSGSKLPKGAISTGSSPVPKCLKYPHPCIGLQGDFSLTDVIDNEAERLREISHPHIMPLEEAITVEVSDEKVSERDRRIPSYLMPFIQSAELCDYLAKPEATAEHLILLLTQAAEAISFLHSSGLVHLDLKPANILVECDSSGRLRALVSDFGFCKRIVDKADGRTLVMGTDGFMDPDLRSLMTRPSSSNPNRVRDRVPRNELKPQFDRYAFGATILDSIIAFLRPLNPDGSPRTLPTSLLRGLLFVALRCSGRHPQAMREHDRYPNRRLLAPEELFRTQLLMRSRIRTQTSSKAICNVFKVIAWHSWNRRSRRRQETLCAYPSECLCHCRHALSLR